LLKEKHCWMKKTDLSGSPQIALAVAHLPELACVNAAESTLSSACVCDWLLRIKGCYDPNGFPQLFLNWILMNVLETNTAKKSYNCRHFSMRFFSLLICEQVIRWSKVICRELLLILILFNNERCWDKHIIWRFCHCPFISAVTIYTINGF
jgi:hypothetical protein